MNPSEPYYLVYWPDSHKYMAHPDFIERAVPHHTSSGAYLLPEGLMAEMDHQLKNNN